MLLDGDVVLLRQIQIFGAKSNIDVYHDKIGGDDGGQFRFVQLIVQRMAVFTPVGAKYQDHILLARAGFGDGRGNVVVGVSSFVINRPGRVRGVQSNAGDNEQKQTQRPDD